MQEWYYVVDGQQQGPISEPDLINLLSNEQLLPKTMVWMQDMADWVQANEVEALKPQVEMPELVQQTVELFEEPVISSAYSEEEIFLHIPISRLIFMSIISCGLYEVYWIYKNWRYLKERDSLNIKPFWRGWFGIFFCHSLLKEIHQDNELNRFETPTFSAGTLATIWVVLILASNAASNIDGAVASIATFLTPSFLCFIPVQIYINRVNAKRNPNAPYTKWTIGHVVCVGLGLLLWILTFMIAADPTLK